VDLRSNSRKHKDLRENLRSNPRKHKDLRENLKGKNSRRERGLHYNS